MMSQHPETAPRPAISLQPEEGWHCQHWFYRFDRQALRRLSPAERTQAC